MNERQQSFHHADKGQVIQSLSLFIELGQIGSFNQFPCVENSSCLLIPLVDGRNIRVGNLGARANQAAKCAYSVFLAGKFWLEQHQGHRAVNRKLQRFMSFGCLVVNNETDQFIVSKMLAGGSYSFCNREILVMPFVCFRDLQGGQVISADRFRGFCLLC